MANPYNLSDAEMKQIDALAAAANRPNVNLMAGMMSGDAPVANMASQIQAQQTRGRQARVGRLEQSLAAKAGREEQYAQQRAMHAERMSATSAAARLAREQALEDQKREREWQLADMVTKQENALELQRLKNQGKTSALAKARARMDAQRRRAEVSWESKHNAPKALSGTQEEKLGDMTRNLESIRRVADTFKPEFQASIGFIGEAQNMLAREFGPLVHRYMPEWEDQAAWHRDYQRHLSLPERHEFFGATLTQGEQKAWKQAEVGPGVSPSAMEKNLKERTDILIGVVTRRATSIAQSKRNPEAVERLVGETIPDFDLPADIGHTPFPAHLYEEAADELERAVEDMTDEELEALLAQ